MTSRSPSFPLARHLLRASLLLALGLPSAWADDGARRSYQVPAGSLASALTRFAGQAGVSLSVDPALVDGLDSPGLQGEYGIDEGFDALLRGSGLMLLPAPSPA
ncbi:STN domain-containing protein, partial [Metapseudomonas otitidis]|uniref:STN domain-containing protein n=1 Tax=Metapseudomonas otitidis TaxID=319939 RepID=UPI001F3EE4C8